MALLTLAPRTAAADLRVVATTPDLANLVRAIGGEHVAVDAMAVATQDPHWVDAKPSLALKLNRADLLVAVGLDLEVGWLPTLQTSARNAAIQTGARGYVEAAQFVDLLETPVRKLDRSMGDVHPGGNPHFNFDPRRMADVARGLAERMIELDPERADAYRQGLAAFLARLDAARRRWEAAMEPLRGSRVITYHRSFPYLLDWLGWERAGTIEPKPGIPPSPGHVQKLLRRAETQRVDLVLMESWYPDRAASLIADRLGAPRVVLPGASRFAAGQGYVAFMDGVVAQLREALPAPGKAPVKAGETERAPSRPAATGAATAAVTDSERGPR